LNTELSNINDLSAEWLHHYIEMRHKLNTEANSIMCISSMLALVAKCGDDTIEVDPYSLGKINQIINTNILNIWEILDDFMYLTRAQSELERQEGVVRQ
jgi:hypothetical protein